jgi:hypothetical protein
MADNTPVPAGAAAPRTPDPNGLALRTLRERRRRVWRTLVLLVLVLVGMVVLTIMKHDEELIGDCRKRMTSTCKIFQDAYDAGQPLPYPQRLDEQITGFRGHCYYDLFQFERNRAAVSEAGVCCCRWPHTRLIGPSARFVIVFVNSPDPHQRRYVVHELDERTFRSKCRAWGLQGVYAR